MSQSLSFSFEFSGLYSRGYSRRMLGREPATWFILWKEVSLKISQIPQEKTPTQVFYCEICEVFHNTYFEERLWTTASMGRKVCGEHFFDCFHEMVYFNFVILTFFLVRSLLVTKTHFVLESSRKPLRRLFYPPLPNTLKNQRQPSEVFYKKVVLKNFAEFIGKHLSQSLFLNKVAGLKPATLLKKTPTQVFSCDFWEIFKKVYFEEPLRTAA